MGGKMQYFNLHFDYVKLAYVFAQLKNISSQFIYLFIFIFEVLEGLH